MPSQFPHRFHWLLLGGWLTASAAHAATYPLPPPDVDVIGQVQVMYATKDDTLIDIARRYGLGYDEIVHANPGVDRWVPGEGTPIVLPTRYILPNTPREGIVLNIPEMRLYYYPKTSGGEQAMVVTYPVSIGRMDWKTPLGLTKVVGKDIDPPWRPPAAIKAEHAAEGDILPDVVPGGPDNPLGRFAMRLGVPGYLIHGTNKPYGIGMQVTHGCVRMYPEDIERIYGMVPVGTSVRLVDQPVKVGRLDGTVFLESHEPLAEDNLPGKVTLEQAQQAVIAKTGPDMPGVDPAALEVAVEQISGIPVAISTEPGAAPAERNASLPPPTAPSVAPATPAPSVPVANRTPVPAAPVSGTPPAYNAASAPPPAYRPATPSATPAAPYGTPAGPAPSSYDNATGSASPTYRYPAYPTAAPQVSPTTATRPAYRPANPDEDLEAFEPPPLSPTARPPVAHPQLPPAASTSNPL